jgi:hypothetical protein
MNAIPGGAIAYIRAIGDNEAIRDTNALHQRKNCEAIAHGLNTHITDFYTDRVDMWEAREGKQPQLEQLLRDLPHLRPKYVIIEHVASLIPAGAGNQLKSEIRIHEISLQILRQGALLEIAIDTSHITK